MVNKNFLDDISDKVASLLPKAEALGSEMKGELNAKISAILAALYWVEVGLVHQPFSPGLGPPFRMQSISTFAASSCKGESS